jgi:hypothetical protein
VVHIDPPNPSNSAERISERYAVVPGDEVFAESLRLSAHLREATDGTVDFQMVQTFTVPEFPLWQDGTRLTWDEFVACRNNTDLCRRGATSYDWIMRQATGTDLCGAIEHGEIDEVWIWGLGYFEWDEFAFRIPGDAVRFRSEPYNPWIYDLRHKDLPECGRTYFVMGFNSERPGGDALHSFGHRMESALTASAPGKGRWGACDGSSEWTDFTCVQKDIPGGASACGNVHFPPNATEDYQYASDVVVPSSCEAWRSYPDVPPAIDFIQSTAWTLPGADSQLDYLKWWFSHLPRNPGVHLNDGILVQNNWWHYALCYDRLCTDPVVEPPADDVCAGGKCRTEPSGCSQGTSSPAASLTLAMLLLLFSRRRLGSR